MGPGAEACKTASIMAETQPKKSTPAPGKRAKTGGKSQSREERKPQVEEEEEPVFSGRMVIAVALGLAMLVIPTSQLGKFITKKAPRTESRGNWQIGDRAELHITVVTSDYDQLACADRRTVGDAHCEWKNERERWPRAEDEPIDDNRLNILQPYKTTDDALVLLSGLWAMPEVAMRLHTEPSRGVSKSQLARFVVTCDVEFVEEWDATMIRWGPGQRWDSPKKVMIGNPKECHIAPSDKP